MIPARHLERTPFDHERNVQWRAGEWTISYLWRYGTLREVWIWQTRSCPDSNGQRRSHALTPDPVGVRDEVDAYELVARALREPAIAPPRWESYPRIADNHVCMNCGYSFDEHDPFNQACPDDDDQARQNAEEFGADD